VSYNPQFQKLAARAQTGPPLTAAVVYPCDGETLQLALSGEFAGYLAPTLVGPEARIVDAARKAGVDIARLPIVDTDDDPRAAAARAVELARNGKAAALIKGSLSIEELLTPVTHPESGLRTDSRLTHAYFLDLPGQDRGLLLADAQLNVNPNLAAKRDIVQNTIELAHALGVAKPHVALLAAMDGASAAFPSTIEALALKEMAAQGLISGAFVDGPFTPETALAADPARATDEPDGVAGNADVLIAPGMEAALMVLRTLLGVTRGLAAGLALGARVPIVVPARGDSIESRMASCVLASLVAARHRAAHKEAPAAAKAGEPLSHAA
jgi:phosphate acetyltransferase